MRPGNLIIAGVFIRGEPAWRPGTNQLLCRVEDGLAVLELDLPEEPPSSEKSN